jgi:hypothetical protein
MLPAEIVYDLASILKLSDEAFVVGGQALNLWAERYSHVSQLEAYGPFTSKDIDYFGQRQAAEKLANALGGMVVTPHPDDHTPQTAIVHAMIAGNHVEIDFLWHVMGVNDAQLKRQAAQIRMKIKLLEGTAELNVPIMHPLHCMQSRLANVVQLGRKTSLALNQLEASPIVLREFLLEQLTNGSSKHVTGVLQALYSYLSTDLVGRKAHKHMSNDPGLVLDVFQDDKRLDERWREKSLRSMRESLRRKRTAWGSMTARIKELLGTQS